MNVVVGLAIGYFLGAKTRGKDLDRLAEALKAIYQTDEFAEVVSAARVQVGHTLEDVAAIVLGDHAESHHGGDLVATVRRLVEHE